MKITSQLIAGFAGSVLAKRYDNPVATPPFHLELWDLCCSNSPLVAIGAPRGHGKSTAVSHAYVLASVLFRDRRFVVLVSDTETQAINFLNDLKAELKDNEDLIALFQIEEWIKDTETDIILKMADGYKFRIMVRGAEQRVRGLKWDQARPDLIVCDDLENEEAVANRDRREKFRRWFEGALIPCKSRDGIVRVVGTVLHMDSQLNRLLPEDSAKGSVVEPLKTYSTARSQWKSIRYRAHDPEFNNLLWPEMYNKEFFQTKKAHLDSQGLSDIYSQEYLNYPIDESMSFFKRDDFNEIPAFELADIKSGKKLVNYYAAIDFAVSTRDRSDYTVIAIAAVDDRGMLNIVDIRRGRWDSLQIIDEMFAVHTKYDPQIFTVERGTIEKSLGPILRSEMLSRGLYLRLHPLTPTKDKMQRARSIQARFRAGGIRFDKGAFWYADLEDEMVRFPRSRHDDQVDAISWLGLTLDEISFALTQKEQDQIEYEEFTREQDQGRDFQTGY